MCWPTSPKAGRRSKRWLSPISHSARELRVQAGSCCNVMQIKARNKVTVLLSIPHRVGGEGEGKEKGINTPRGIQDASWSYS